MTLGSILVTIQLSIYIPLGFSALPPKVLPWPLYFITTVQTRYVLEKMVISLIRILSMWTDNCCWMWIINKNIVGVLGLKTKCLAAQLMLIYSYLIFGGVFLLWKWDLARMMIPARNSPFLSVILIAELCISINLWSPSQAFVEVSSVQFALRQWLGEL